MSITREFSIENLFTVKSGDFHATKELDNGNIPLISCGNFSNGLVGYFDIPENKTYSHTITVAYNGLPLTAKYHPYIFGAKDDVAVLLPKAKVQEKTLLYIASLFNNQSWRYSYGRKCFKRKLTKFSFDLPTTPSGTIDEQHISSLFPSVTDVLPPKNDVKNVEYQCASWKLFKITEFFDLKRGDFHSLSHLDEGDVNTVSRISYNNGVVGHHSPPEKAKLYESGLITVSTVTGEAFVQPDQFIATDNVVVCMPKKPLELAGLFFIALMINRVRWRYSYGRQCYKTKFAEMQIYLPVDKEGKLDESLMANTIRNTPYWSFLSRHFA